MRNSLLPNAPSLDEPLEILQACHERIEAQLETLEKLLAYLPDHGADEHARQAIQAILRYFDSAGPNHHEDEEQDLFPALIACAPEDEADKVAWLVQNLLSDHARMASALDLVKHQLVAVAAGDRSALTPVAVHALTLLYRQHIEKENRELLPLSRRLLRPADIKKLSLAMTARRHPSHQRRAA